MALSGGLRFTRPFPRNSSYWVCLGSGRVAVHGCRSVALRGVLGVFFGGGGCVYVPQSCTKLDETERYTLEVQRLLSLSEVNDLPFPIP